MPNIEAQLKESGIFLPSPITPNGNYIPALRYGQLLFVSGHICRREGKPFAGKFGDKLTHEQGYELARLTVIDMLSTIRITIGSLDHVERIIKLTGMVNSTATFIQQSAVINGASDLLAVLWGEHGIHARSAFGVQQLPLGAAVELEMICALEDGF